MCCLLELFFFLMIIKSNLASISKRVAFNFTELLTRNQVSSDKLISLAMFMKPYPRFVATKHLFEGTDLFICLQKKMVPQVSVLQPSNKSFSSGDINVFVRGLVKVPYCCRLYLRLGDLSRSSR